MKSRPLLFKFVFRTRAHLFTESYVEAQYVDKASLLCSEGASGLASISLPRGPLKHSVPCPPTPDLQGIVWKLLL